MKMKKIITSVLVAATAFGLVACGNSGSGDSAKSDSSAKSTDKKEIVYGKSQGPYTELFEDAIVPILEKEGYKVKGVDLSDLQTADVALNDGDVDVNVEQHTAYMENFNKSYNGDLVHGLKVANIEMNRKMLAEMAVNDPAGFAAVAEVAKSKLA